MAKAGKARGRRQTWDLADAVCEWLESGRPLAEWCRGEGRPSRAKVHAWRDENEAFARRFARAREIGHDALADDLIELVEAPVQVFGQLDGKGNLVAERMDPVDVQRRRLEVEAKLKLLACWSAAYRPGVKIEHSVDESLGKRMDAAHERLRKARGE